MRMLKFLLVVAVMACAPQAHAQFNLGDLVKKGLDTGKKLVDASKPMTEKEELDAGEGVAAMILGASPPYADDNLQKYVNRVGRWVAAQSGRPDLPWTFGVIDTPSVNAFAVPGGKIFVSVGLMRKLKSESELAGVLAHEVAHVSLKHQVQAIEAAKKSGVLQAAGQELANERIAQSRAAGNPLTGALATAAAAEGIEFVKNGVFLRPLDKALEYDADRLGVVLAARAGYDPYGLIAAIQLLATLKEEESGASLIMSTHPAPNDRLAELEKFTSTLDKYASQPQVEGRYAQAMAAAK